jgi:hypothetical protein
VSGDRQAGGSHWSGKLSSLYSSGSYLEGYGGGENGSTAGFDPMNQIGGRQHMGALWKIINGPPTNPNNGEGINPPVDSQSTSGSKSGWQSGYGLSGGCNCQDCRAFLEKYCTLVDPHTGEEHYDDLCCGLNYLALCPAVMIEDPCEKAGKGHSCKDLVCGFSPPGAWDTNACICTGLQYGGSLSHAWQSCNWCQYLSPTLKQCCEFLHDTVTLAPSRCPKITSYNCPLNAAKYPTSCQGICPNAQKEYSCNPLPCKGANDIISTNRPEGPCTQLNPSNYDPRCNYLYIPRPECAWTIGCWVEQSEFQYSSCRNYCANKGVVYP